MRLDVLAVELLLGFVELPQLLGLSFAQLFTVGVVSRETLEAQRRSALIHTGRLEPQMFTVWSNLEYLSVSGRNISDAGIFILASFAIWNRKGKR